MKNGKTYDIAVSGDAQPESMIPEPTDRRKQGAQPGRDEFSKALPVFPGNNLNSVYQAEFPSFFPKRSFHFQYD